MDNRILDIVKNIDKNNVNFIYLIGSYARNEQNEFSDVDIIVALKPGIDTYSENKYIGNTYVSIHYDSAIEMINNYSDPYKYIRGHIGIKDMVVLYSEPGKIEDFKERCLNVNYLVDFEKAINVYVNNETVDWIEEVNKAVSGYLNNNSDKMIAGIHGLTYGMLDVLGVSEGIIRSKTGIIDTYNTYFNNDSNFMLLENSFGIKALDINSKVYNGLLLYEEIIKIIEYRFTKFTKDNVEKAIKNIQLVLVEKEVRK